MKSCVFVFVSIVVDVIAMTCACVRVAVCAPPRVRSVRTRAVHPTCSVRNVRLAVSASDDASGTPEKHLALEKADALRAEYDGVRVRASRLLKRGARLAKQMDELTGGAERAMGLGADRRDENEARRLLRERAQVKEALAKTIARAEILSQLASKIEIAIIVLERSAFSEEKTTTRDDRRDDSLGGGTVPSIEAAFGSSKEGVKRKKRGPLESLESEFASLEVNVLERAFSMSPDLEKENSKGNVPRSSGDNVNTGRSTETKEADGDLTVTDTVPGWWLPESIRESKSDSPKNAKIEKPLDALLSLDRARVSSVGVLPKDAVNLRISCAAYSADKKNVSLSKRLEGGKRDTAFRAAVEGALGAVELFDEDEKDSTDGDDKWRALGGQPPLHFLCDFARDLGLRPSRAGTLLTEAVVRRVESFCMQCAAFLRAGDFEAAQKESKILKKTLAHFAGAVGTVEDKERLQLIALRTRKQLRQHEREKVLTLFHDAPESVRTAAAIALGLRE